MRNLCYNINRAITYLGKGRFNQEELRQREEVGNDLQLKKEVKVMHIFLELLTKLFGEFPYKGGSEFPYKGGG